jgi:hypothetical protein
MGEIICLLLRNIAVKNPKRIVITAIHTPSSRVFMLFSHVTLLTSQGELAYWGRREDVSLLVFGFCFVWRGKRRRFFVFI